MIDKPRIFVFGDSWANNYLTNKINPYHGLAYSFLANKEIQKYAKGVGYYGHWLDHMSNFYEVHTFGMGSASIEEIILQLGNLPDFEEGDKCIIIFSTPVRIPWYDKNKIVSIAPNNWEFNLLGSNKDIVNLLVEQMEAREHLWKTSKYMTLKKFIDKQYNLLSKYSPVFCSWDRVTSDHVKSIDYICSKTINNKYNSIYRESNGDCIDYHLGVKGNYELFKYLASKLKLDISEYNPLLPEYKETGLL